MRLVALIGLLDEFAWLVLFVTTGDHFAYLGALTSYVANAHFRVVT